MNELPSAGIVPARILLVDDHPVVRQGLIMALEGYPDLQVCGEAATVNQAMLEIAAVHPGLILADLDLEGMDGIDLIKAVRREYPDIPVLILSMHEEDLYAERVLRAGARGYMMKQEPTERLAEGIRAVLAGEIVLSAKMKSKILGNLSLGRNAKSLYTMDRLTDRELGVFRLVGCGQSTRQIAERLSLSSKTVESHLAHIKRKLGAESSREMQRRAFNWVTGAADVPAAAILPGAPFPPIGTPPAS